MFTLSCRSFLWSASSRCSSFWHKARPRIVNFPWAGGQCKTGVALAPEHVSKICADLFADEEVHWVDLEPWEKRGNLYVEQRGNIINFEATFSANRKLCEKMIALGNERPQLVIGGDHSMAIGSVQAALQLNKELQVIWIDAHPDVSLPADSWTKRTQGMCVTYFTGLETETRQEWMTRFLPIQRLHFFGIRNFDTHELRLLQDYKVKFPPVDKLNAAEDWGRFLRRLEKDIPVHISFDVDVIDPAFMPCTGSPVTRGMTVRKTLALLSHLLNNFRVVSMDVAEINMELGSDFDRQRSEQALRKIFKLLLNKNDDDYWEKM